MTARRERATRGGTTTAQEALSAALAALPPADKATPCQRRHRARWTSDDLDEREWAASHCQSCPVLAECAAAAEENREVLHVFGGVDRTQRRTKVTG